MKANHFFILILLLLFSSEKSNSLTGPYCCCNDRSFKCIDGDNQCCTSNATYKATYYDPSPGLICSMYNNKAKTSGEVSKCTRPGQGRKK
jgi:hypothetical protein